jgi:D-ribose pyranose/furanose isomerase RbsD
VGRLATGPKECKNPKEKKVEAHLVQVDNNEPTFLMVMFCVLHDVEVEEVAAAE